MKTFLRPLLICIGVLCLSHFSLASDNRVYTYDMRAMMKEIKEFTKTTQGSSLNVDDIVQKYLPLDRPKEEIFSVLNNHEFHTFNTERKSMDSEEFDEGFTSSTLFWIPRFLFTHELRLILYFNEGKLEKLQGHVFLQSL